MTSHTPPIRHTALHSLTIVARRFGLDLSVDRLIHDHALGDAEPDPRALVRIIKRSGLNARRATLTLAELGKLGAAFPVLARLGDGSTVVVGGYRTEPDGDLVGLIDPQAAGGAMIAVPVSQFASTWTGEVFFVKPRLKVSDPQQPFGILWFVPELLRQKGIFFNVGVAAVMLLAIGLAVPLFFQLVIDKVLPHQGYSTLYVLGIAVGLALVFETIFGFLRTYLLLYATNRIDMRTATRTFGRMMLLPTWFFEQIPAGVLIRHMQQVRRIREFLSGRLFLTLLDSLALVIFLPLLFLYSGLLTALVLGFSLLIAAIMAVLLPVLRRRLFRLYEAESQRQAFLTETVHGIATVKALALEPQSRQIWEDRTAGAIHMQFDVAKLSLIAQSLTGFFEKLLTVAIIVVGAQLVFAGDMTLGALVAFNMLSSRVSQPLGSLIGLVHEYQEAALAVKMLGSVMNQPPERAATQRGTRPRINGEITFSGITMTYGPNLPPAVRDLSFTVPAGSFFGIVGTSGAGKTTVTRLMQGLISPQSGVVRIGGVDVREIDLVHLRRSVGVVLQDNFIFRGTIRDNIAMGKRDASMEDIVEAARLGGALEFIERLPQGFETALEEDAVNLSGGQKQRLAIARALVRNPRILLFDEATSALDPESEAIVFEGLNRIRKDRTVIMVSHRLASLTEADEILVLDRGTIAGIGPHTELAQSCAPYKKLWERQTQFMR